MTTRMPARSHSVPNSRTRSGWRDRSPGWRLIGAASSCPHDRHSDGRVASRRHYRFPPAGEPRAGRLPKLARSRLNAGPCVPRFNRHTCSATCEMTVLRWRRRQAPAGRKRCAALQSGRHRSRVAGKISGRGSAGRLRSLPEGRERQRRLASCPAVNRPPRFRLAHLRDLRTFREHPSEVLYGRRPRFHPWRLRWPSLQ
jgi:hypothetical protein